MLKQEIKLKSRHLISVVSLEIDILVIKSIIRKLLKCSLNITNLNILHELSDHSVY